MGCKSVPNEDDPPVLQLRKWGASEFPYNPSHFKEGFISPARRHLLLLSYDSDGLLISLDKGPLKPFDHSGTAFDGSISASLGTDVLSSFISRENISSLPEVVELDNDAGSGSAHAFFSDVDSVAWGLTEATGAPSDDASFQELLFISGKDGVVVHIFSKSDEFRKVANSVDDGGSEHGKWVEWGPVATSYTPKEGHGEPPLVKKDSDSLYPEREDGRQSGSPKVWAQSFLAEAESVNADDTAYTKFSKKSSFPKNAVASFRIFTSNSQFPDFLSCSGITLCDIHKPCIDPKNKSPTCEDGGDSALRVSAVSSLCNCVKVFSDNSAQFVGFSLSMICSACASPSIVNSQSCCKVVVAVSRTFGLGLKWLYSTVLGSNLEWIDFTFSYSFLVCLSKSGLISLHGATSGTYVGLVDVSNVSTLGSYPSYRPENDNDILDDASEQLQKKRFKRIYTFPHSSLLGVMDECGVIYVLLTDDHFPDEQFFYENTSPYPCKVELGLLSSWDIGGTDIGFPSVLRIDAVRQGIRGSELQCKSPSEIDEACPKHMFSGKPMKFKREVFLPVSGFNEDDNICFSPFGITRLIRRPANKKKLYEVVHANLQLDLTVKDENYRFHGWQTLTSEAVGCNYHGFLYLVTEKGISVVLPSISASQESCQVEAVIYNPVYQNDVIHSSAGDLTVISKRKQLTSPWKMEVLDKIFLYEAPNVAEKLSLENGWNLGTARIRHLQLALNFLEFDQIQNSLEMLMEINLAVEGILQLLFTTVYLMLYNVRNDSEVSSASRLLALATTYATMAIRKYGLIHLSRVAVRSWDAGGNKSISHPSELTDKEHDKSGDSKNLWDMAKLLVVIRCLCRKLNDKHGKLGLILMDNMELLDLAGADLSESGLENPIKAEGDSLLDVSALSRVPAVGTELHNDDNLALVSSGINGAQSTDVKFDRAVLLAEGNGIVARTVKVENPKDMIARWDLSYMDLNTVVKDALLSGRLPLAVLRLHLHRLNNNTLPDTDTHDTFTDVRTVGRAIAYDLFIKGEIDLAVTTLQKLGEDVEIVLKHLVFGTLRRSLRKLVAEEMSRYVHLEPHELKILDTMTLIERIYPCSSFSSTLVTRRTELTRASNADVEKEMVLHLLHPQMNLSISCGEVDGVVVGPWINLDEHLTAFEADDDNNHFAYWAAAVAWADAWDQRVIDRVLLGQPLLMGVHLLWESQLEYSMCHNDWLEVSKLLEILPPHALSRGSLNICLHDSFNMTYLEELDGVEVSINVPAIKVFRFGANRLASVWLRTLMEQQLAKRLIFLTDYWPGTAEITTLLAQSGFLIEMHDTSSMNRGNTSDSLVLVSDDSSLSPEAIQTLHKVVISFSSQYNLLHLLDIYLDIHQLVLDQDSLSFFLDAAGDNEWVKFLLLLRVEGKEYDASFTNACAIASHNIVPGNKHTVLEAGGITQAVDGIAEVAREMASLATLMFAPIPLQKCISSGSVSRWYSSAQCTLENLRPALQKFPTLWKTLVTACFGQDSAGISVAVKSKMSGYSDLLEYLNWREGVFFSSTQDTSILQMIPYWFPKGVRRLIQLYVQGPICWRIADLETDELSMLRDIYYVLNSSGHAEISALSWESAVQKHIEEELYASSLEGAEVGLQHHLHHGRAFSAFSHLLLARVHKLKSSDESKKSAAPSTGQFNVNLDVQNILTSVSEIEVSLLASVMPLAIEHFDDDVLVSSCVFLLGLCGLSATALQVDVATLKRISHFYKSADSVQHRKHLSIRILGPSSVEIDLTVSLAQTLSDYYLHEGVGSIMNRAEGDTGIPNRPSQALQLVLQHLEKASLPTSFNELTCGSWLMDGNGNGALLRSEQKAASERWKLVTAFCQVHGIPPSTKYLAVLAKDNDWVGFLSEAQVGRFPFDIVIQVVSKEFGDPRLKTHILTVLKTMQLKRKIGMSNLDTAKSSVGAEYDDHTLSIPTELFGIIAECEKQERPGEALLLKAKNLSWSILAIIASCFHDVSLLSCLTVWLEITAAREISTIKANDVASQIAKNVGAAVEATNSLPGNSRAVLIRHNKKTSKRRRLVKPIPVDSLVSEAFHSSGDNAASEFQGAISEMKENKPSSEDTIFSKDSNSLTSSLSRMIAVLCGHHLFLPLLQGFELFLPSCSVLPFIRSLQAFSQMRLPDAAAHLGSFSIRVKEDPSLAQANWDTEGKLDVSWTISTAVKAADAMLLNCPSVYEKRCLLKLLANADFGDAGSVAMRYQQQSWKLDMAEPNLRSDECPLLGNETFDDASLLTALEKNGYWEQARSWAKQLEASGEPSWKFSSDHVTEMQAEAMVAEWKEFLWDVPEERVALWHHCQTLFVRFSYPALKAGQFFLKHADIAERGTQARELHKILLLALQWLSGMITQSNMCCPLHFLRDIETRVWLLVVEAESQVKIEAEDAFTCATRELGASNDTSLIDQTASITAKIDKHLSTLRMKLPENEHENRYSRIPQAADPRFSSAAGAARTKRRAKGNGLSRKPLYDAMDKNNYSESVSTNLSDDPQIVDESFKVDASSWRWEERVGHAELEKTVLSLLDFGQITAARQLQAKLSPESTPSEFSLVDAALKLAAASTPSNDFHSSKLENDVRLVIESYNIPTNDQEIDPAKVLESLAIIPMEGKGRGLCKRIVSVVRAANVLGLVFSEAFEKQPIELLRLLSLKAQDSFEEAKLLVHTHPLPAASIAQILAESFLKGLLAAHRGGYIDFQKEEGPAPLLWRFSDFLKWAEFCPSQSEIGHALMKLVITGQEIPHACEVELLILSHHFYKLSACLDGVDVLVTLAATRVDAYVRDKDFSCLARLITGVGNFHALNFILGILIENGQVELLLQKYSAAANANNSTADAIRGFRMAVLTSLKQLNPTDFDAFALVYNHFDMKHDAASLLEYRGIQSSQYWFYDKYQNVDLLESLRYFTEAAELYSSIDAGRKTRSACAQASLVSLQIRMPDMKWLYLSPTNARRVLVQQTRFPEAVIVAEAYGLNQPTEWALVLWERMLHPESTELFLAEFVAALPLQPSMLLELARFYKLEMQARGGQSHFSVWLSGGGLPADWAKYLNRSFRSLLKRARDFRLKLQMAVAATGFDDIIAVCNKVLDKVPENAGPLILRKGHGGAYLPLM